MTERLPTPGGDQDAWAAILNGYLGVEHAPDGTHDFTGTPTGTKFLGDDRTWKVPPSAEGVPGWLNVQDYGAAGNGSTNDSAAIQAAIDDLPTSGNIRGGTVYFPKPSYYYKCTTALSLVDKPPITFVGDSAPSFSATHGTGTTIGTGTASMILVNAINTGVSHEGHRFYNLNFRDVAGGSTLLSIKDSNNGVIRDCCFRDAAVGIKFDGDTNIGDDSTWVVDHALMRSCTKGIDTYGYTNNLILGGYYVNSPVLTDGYTTQLRIVGVKFNGGNPAITIKGFMNTVALTNFEGCTKCIKFDADPGIWGAGPLTYSGGVPTGRGNVAVWNQYTGSGSGTAIEVTANAAFTEIAGGFFSSYTTEVSDAGYYTNYSPQGLTAVKNTYSTNVPVFDLGGAIKLREMSSDPTAPPTNSVELYARDNGSGKTQIVARFPTGAIQVLSTEP